MKPSRRMLVLMALGVVVFVAAIFLANYVTTPPQADAPRDATNFNTIEPGLTLGGRISAPPPGTRAVLNVCEFPDAFTVEVSQWKPIRDAAPAPSLAWLKTQVDFIAAQRAAGRPTFVHCNAGISRGPMVLTAYLMQRDHLTRDQALAHLRTLRPAIHPNDAFMALLADWQHALEPAATAP